MPQTRFVTSKAFERGLNPIVVVNKIDRDGARPDWVVDQIFDLFDALGANEAQLDFPVVYTSAVLGIAGDDPAAMAEDMTPLFEAIERHVPAPDVDIDGRFAAANIGLRLFELCGCHWRWPRDPRLCERQYTGYHCRPRGRHSVGQDSSGDGL